MLLGDARFPSIGIKTSFTCVSLRSRPTYRSLILTGGIRVLTLYNLSKRVTCNVTAVMEEPD